MENLSLEDLLDIIKYAPDGWEKYSPLTSKTFKSYAKEGFIYVVESDTTLRFIGDVINLLLQ